MVLIFLALELILNSAIVAASTGRPCLSSSWMYFSAQLRAACLRTFSVSTGTVYQLDKLSLWKSAATFRFNLSAFSTSSQVVDTDRAVFIDAAMADDADCRICLGVTLIFLHAVVKSPAVTGVGGSELAFLLDSRGAFHRHLHQWFGHIIVFACGFLLLFFETASVSPQAGSRRFLNSRSSVAMLSISF